MNSTYCFRLSLIFLSLLSQAHLYAGAIVQCKNNKGSEIYTNEVRYCSSEVIEQKLSANNLLSSYHIAIDTNYSIHRRDYSAYENNGGWTIYYETEMAEESPSLSRYALARLVNVLAQVESVLPRSAITELKTVDFYLMWGKASPQGGKSSGARYIRNNEREHRDNIDPRWNNSVVIFSANNFMNISSAQAKLMIAHELAHAWHLLACWKNNPAIKAAASNAEQKKLYHLLKAKDGSYLAKAYAMTNYLEYFAELSAIYFVGGNYFPFQRSELKLHDPQGYQLMTELWPEQTP